MLTLYDYLPSQNAYKVRLLLNHLDRPYRTEMISIFEGEGRQEWYLAISPTGTVPAIKLEHGQTLAESNAILTFLAEGTQYIPDDPFGRAKVLQWLFFEADYVQATIATLRYWVLTNKCEKRPPELVKSKKDASLRTLAILDRQLATEPFLAGERYTVADMSIYAYVHLAADAELPLLSYSNVSNWIARVQSQDGFLRKTYPYSIDPNATGEL